jgi:hypothetical protein
LGIKDDQLSVENKVALERGEGIDNSWEAEVKDLPVA